MGYSLGRRESVELGELGSLVLKSVEPGFPSVWICVSRTGEHGDAVDVIEASVVLTIEGGPDIRNKNLWPLHDAYFATLESGTIVKAREVVREKVYKFASTVISGLDKIDHAAIEILDRSEADSR